MIRLDEVRHVEVKRTMEVSESVSDRIGWEQPGREESGKTPVQEEMAGRGLSDGDWLD